MKTINKKATIFFYPILALITLFLLTSGYLAVSKKTHALSANKIGNQQYEIFENYASYYKQSNQLSHNLELISNNLLISTALNTQTGCGSYLGIAKWNNASQTLDDCIDEKVFWNAYLKKLKERNLAKANIDYVRNKDYVMIYGFEK